MAYLRAIIKGRVQGVGFRFFVFDLALRYGLKGVVRNLWEGGVEVEVDGQENELRDFLRELKKGPPLAKIKKVQTEWSENNKGFDEFQITS